MKKQLDEANIDERIIKRQEADHLVDDQGRAGATPKAAERLAPPTHRVGLGPPRCRRSIGS